jgi:hypothetical protein
MKTPKNQTAPAAPTVTLPEGQPVPATTVAAVKVPGKRGRTHLTQADKDHMQACRKIASAAKGQLALVLANDGITDPAVFEGVPAFQFDLIAGVVKGVKAVQANSKMAQAKAQYEKLCKASGTEPDAALMAAAPVVDEPKRHKYTEDEKTALATARANVTNGLTLGLLDERITDARIWSDLPAAKLDAISAVTVALAADMSAKGVSEAKATLAALLADAGMTPAPVAPVEG